MADRAFNNADGDMLIVPQAQALHMAPSAGEGQSPDLLPCMPTVVRADCPSSPPQLLSAAGWLSARDN